MPKLSNYSRDMFFEKPDNAAKLKEVKDKYGLKMTRRDVCEYLKISRPTVLKWLVGLPCAGSMNGAIRYWTSDVVYRDISTQTIQEAS